MTKFEKIIEQMAEYCYESCDFPKCKTDCDYHVLCEPLSHCPLDFRDAEHDIPKQLNEELV